MYCEDSLHFEPIHFLNLMSLLLKLVVAAATHISQTHDMVQSDSRTSVCEKTKSIVGSERGNRIDELSGSMERVN